MPNEIYVIPPGKEITIEGRSFRVQPKSKVHGFSNVITTFLESLVRDRTPAGICVILSGMDHDGASALRQFSGAGGITIVQSAPAASHPDMPNAAMRTGCADYILPPEAIAPKLEDLSRTSQEEGCK